MVPYELYCLSHFSVPVAWPLALRQRIRLDLIAVAFAGEGSDKQDIRYIDALLRCMGGVGVHLQVFFSCLQDGRSEEYRRNE
jgi:hypothetical protein